MNNFSRFSSTTSPAGRPATPDKALEITLHDGLDRLEDFFLMMAFQHRGPQFEILAITPPADSQHLVSPRQPTTHTPTNEKVVCIQTALLRKTA